MSSFNLRVLSVATSLLFSLIFSSNAIASDCSQETSARITRRCRLAIARSILRDGSLSSLRQTLESSYPLRNCREQGSQRNVDVVKDDAGKSVLEISSYFRCASKDEVYGYTVTGHYFTDEGIYRFKGIALLHEEY